MTLQRISGSMILDGTLSIDDLVALVQQALVPTGAIADFLATTPPTGWLKANGALVSRATYPALWSYAQASGLLITDTAWLAGATASFSTGDGSTTFRLPDLRGEFRRGWDDGRGLDASRTLGSVQSEAIGPHQHNANGLTNRNTVSGGSDQVLMRNGTVNGLSNAVGNTGAGIGSENRPRNVSVLVCIKT